MTAPPFSDLQSGFQRKTPISLPTWILSGSGIFQIEYSRCGFARWSSPGQATRTRRQEELISRSPNTQTCSRHILQIHNLQWHPLKGASFQHPIGGLFSSALELVWQVIACQSLCHRLINPISQIVSNKVLPYIPTLMSVLVFSKCITWSSYWWIQCELLCTCKTSQDALLEVFGEGFHTWGLTFVSCREGVVKHTYLVGTSCLFCNKKLAADTG